MKQEYKWWVLLVIGVGSFMSSLSTGVVNIILPILQRTFRSDVASVEWVTLLYLLVLSGALLPFGRLGDLYGHRPLYILGLILFALSSAVCGFAQTVEALIVFRGLEALGAAMYLANETAILTSAFPAVRRGRVLGLQSTMSYLGLVAGPPLGGWLAGRLGWQSVFFINIPLSLVGLALGLRFVPRDTAKERIRHFDMAGAVVLFAGLAALLLALNRGQSWGWASAAILTLLTTAVVALAAFLAIERHTPSPILDLTLFRSRVFSSATVSSVFNNICVSSILFLLPFALIQGHGLSPATVGLILAVRSLVMAGVAPLSGILSDRLGPRLPRAAGLILLSLGTLLLARLGSETSLVEVAAGLAIVGLGSGTFISPNNSALMGAAPDARRGIAGGVLATARNIGMALGTGLAGAVFSALLAGQSGVAPNVIFHAAQLGLLLAAAAALAGALIPLFYEGSDLERRWLERESV